MAEVRPGAAGCGRAVAERGVRTMAADDVLVRCPVCRHEQAYAPVPFPCVCGAPVVPPVTHGPAVPLTHRTRADAWVTVRCAACGRAADWPRPELGCACGTVLRVPVASPDEARRSRTPPHVPLPPTAATPRAAFRPRPVRDARDAVTAVTLFLRWLGYEDVRDAGPDDERPPSGARLTALGVVAQIEPTVRHASLRDVECAWLTAMTHSATCVCFALRDFTPQARARADELHVALFRIDLTGVPEPLNDAAHELTATGA